MIETIALAFHGIGAPGRAMEAGEPRYWITRDQFLQALDLVAADPNPSRVLLTFDDGNASDFEIALPALQDRGLTASFFVIVNRLGQEGSLGADQLRALAKAGMLVGSHGVEHVDWRKQGPLQLADELLLSRQALEACLARPVQTASIPFGRYNARVLSAARNAGYQQLFSSDGGASAAGDWLVGRTNIRTDTTLADLADLLHRRERLTQRVARKLKAFRRTFT